MKGTELKNIDAPTSRPSKLKLIGESRTIFNAFGSLLPLAISSLTATNQKTGMPIILLPGFASDERYLKPLAKHLSNHGYHAEGWGLGVNMAGANYQHTLEDLSPRWHIEPKPDYDPAEYKGEGGVPLLCDMATKRIKQRANELGEKVILIGWSLGGYIAREVARDLPDQVAQIITLGSPVIGGPKYTAAAPFFINKGFDLDWVEREAEKRNQYPIKQAITAIYSKSDGIVDWRATIDKFSPNVNHIEVNASHLGMGFNRTIWKHIIRTLEAH